MFITKTHLVEVFFTKLVLNLKSEASKTYLSYVWWILEPALMVAVLYLVFAVFLAMRTPDFVVFLVCGKIPFLWFSKSISHASQSITGGRGLIHQVSIPMPFFPLLAVFQDSFKQSIVFILMVTFIFLYGMEVSWIWLSVLFVIFTQLLLICSLALVAAAIVPFLPDFKYLISTGMMALMFGSGIFYDYKERIRPEHHELFLSNPLASLITNYRQVLLENTLPDWAALTNISLISLALIAMMMAYYNKTSTIYARLIAQ